MNTSRQIKAIRFYIGAAALVVGGFGLFMFHECSGGRLDDFVMLFSIDVAVFVCAICGYFLLQAVSHARLHAIIAVLLFVVSAIGSALIAPLMMFASKVFWPDFFRGEQGLNFIAAPVYASLLSLGLLICFLICIFFCRTNYAKPGA
jgi:glucan phosphoethanolaminetransferase (alkaline phosphatase superfamily)